MDPSGACPAYLADDYGPRASWSLRYGRWVGQSTTSSAETPSESIVVSCISDQQFEVHCHGGKAAIDRILADLELLGVPTQTQCCDQELLNQDQDPLITQACVVLQNCVSDRTAAIAMEQVRGAFRDWRDQSLDLLNRGSDSVTVVAKQAAEIAARGKIGVRLERGWDVVLAGAPNVGKSTLVNAMVGFDRSITMDLPGTTRDVLDANTVYDGWPLRIRDTAGLRQAESDIEREGVFRARSAINEADLVVLVLASCR